MRDDGRDLVDALRECANDLAAEIEAKYPDENMKYPSERRRYRRDMQPVLRARYAIAKWENGITG